MTPELVGRSKPEGVRGRKSFSGSEMTERQSSQEGRLYVVGPKKRIKVNLNRRDWYHGLVKLSRTHDWINMLLFFLRSVSHIM